MSLKRFVCTAWFRDTRTAPDDQDHEWPACYLIEGATPEAALQWGDHLARAFSSRRVTEVYLRSTVEVERLAERDRSSGPWCRWGTKPRMTRSAGDSRSGPAPIHPFHDPVRRLPGPVRLRTGP